MSIIAIDPGTTHTGLIHMNETCIISAKTMAFDKPVKVDQDALRKRAEDIASFIRAWIKDKEFEAIVIEGFISFSSRMNAYVFQTPYLCGYLHSALRDFEIVIQTSSEVLAPKRRGSLAHLKEAVAHGESVWPGDEVCTNDHLRSALCHGIYYYASRVNA